MVKGVDRLTRPTDRGAGIVKKIPTQRVVSNTMPQMGDVSVVLLLVGVVIAFVAGKRWQHIQRATADYRLARTGLRTTRKTRLLSLRAVSIAIILLAAYLIGTFQLAVDRDEGKQPRPAATSAPVDQ